MIHEPLENVLFHIFEWFIPASITFDLQYQP